MHSKFVICHENAAGFEQHRKYVYNLLPIIFELTCSTPGRPQSG